MCDLNTISSNNPIMTRQQARWKLKACKQTLKQQQQLQSNKKLYKYRIMMEILLAIAACFIIQSVKFSNATTQVQERTAPTTQTAMMADTTSLTERQQSAATSHEPTLTVFKIQKQALHNDSGSSNDSEEQSWRLIDKSEAVATVNRTANELSHSSIPPPEATSPQPSASSSSPAPPATVSFASSSRSPSVLRPSIEEVASKLSRKHLNLQHDNWRLNKQSPSSSPSLSPSQPDDKQPKSADGSAVTSMSPNEAELDIQLPQVSSTDAVRQQAESFDDDGIGVFSTAPISAKMNEGHQREHYLHVGDAAIAAATTMNPEAASTTNRPKSRRPGGGRRKKGAFLLTGEAFEQSECHQYLRIYNAPATSTNPGAPTGLYQMISNQQLPCSCEWRSVVFSTDFTATNPEASGDNQAPLTSWLSCDHVQLVGGYLQPQSSQGNTTSAGSETWNMGKVSTDMNAAGDNTAGGSVQVTRFSQRDSGLQTLQAQKFLNLQLPNLRSIDLRDNRIRQIKMDAFHGLELSLENLNLANNLLGDSRAISYSAQNSNTNQKQQQHQQQSRGKLIFVTDEFNRLKKLKWLSLRNNQINQLSSTIFTRQSLANNPSVSFVQDPTSGNLAPQTRDTTDEKIATAELVYLDLSENILKSVPSDAIESLNKLQTLNLRANKITQLDQSSKFPTSLKYLDLSANLIKTIRNCDLIDLPDLIELNLSHNQLSQLDKSAFLSSSSAALATLPSASNKPQQLAVETNLDGTSTGSVGVVSSLSSSQFSNNLIVSNQAVASADSNQASSIRQSSRSLVPDESRVSSSNNNNNDELARFLAGGVNEQTKSSSHLVHRTHRGMGEDSLSLSLAVASEFSQTAPRRTLRTRRDVISSEDELTATGARSSIMKGEEEDYDLDAEESGLSGSFAMLASQQRRPGSGEQQQTMGDDEAGMMAMMRRQREFNSTIKLNLAFNYFTSLPGDSLLKFPNLQQLDLSYNRIRNLDSNYLCSIYNLVESLRELDLSGNLLTLPQSNSSLATQATAKAAPTIALSSEDAPVAAATIDTAPAATSGRQLNRLFGCLQKLERLSLATNRLSSSPPAGKRSKAASVNEDSGVTSDEEEDEFSGRPSSAPTGGSSDRLHIKFGDNFGSRHLNQLDLSDNQLRLMPLIEQVFQQPTSLMFSSNGSANSSISAATAAANDQQQQHQLNQWMASRVYVVSLNLSYNYIDRLEERDFDHLFSLRKLSFDFNRLSSLPTKLMHKFTSLDRASFDGNRLSSLEPLNELFERSIKTLRYLSLANNRLTVWPAINKVLYENPLRQEYSSPIDSDDKQASALQFSLEELNLEGNLFTSSNVSTLFDQFTYMKSLRILNLSQNLLNRVRSEWFKFANGNLKVLQLTGNKINSIDLGSFAFNQVNELEKLQLDHNLLKELKRKTFDALPKLRELDLSHNFIHTINSESFHQMNSMLVLDLSNNKLTSWKCEYFSNLCNSISGNINADLHALLSIGVVTSADTGSDIRQPVSALIELDLSHNSLSQLRVNSISVHTKLERLNLAHNKLSYIPHDLFKATILDPKTGRQIQLVSSLKQLNLAHNRIQTVDNINLRPLRNLVSFDLSYNELQTLGVDVILIDNYGGGSERKRNLIVGSENSTNLLMDSSTNDAAPHINQQRHPKMLQQQQHQTGNGLPALGKLRHLNLSHNQLTQVNQSLLHELSPFVLLNLDLSHNYLESESLPYGFYAKISGPSKQQQPTSDLKSSNNYDLVFTLKLESLTLSHNRLSEFPSSLLENHHISMESCNLAHNRIQTLVPNSNVLIQIKTLNLEFNPLNRESNELILFEHKSARHLNLAATRLYAIKEVTQLATGSSDRLTQQSQQQLSAQKHRLVANQTSQLDLIRSISKPIDAPYVQHLNLSSNQLVWLAANIFERMHSLQTLDLSNNQLTRLHLLTNQLAPLSASLESLNLASNLFTSIDETDFSQLNRLQHLDLSSLLSLQKLNCRFLSKLTTLRSLRLFNFPQVRHNLNNIISNLQHKQKLAQLYNSNQPADSHAAHSSERLMRKLQQELLMSTIGKHCFRDEAISSAQLETETGLRQHELPLKWFNLEELELELFTTYDIEGSEGDQAAAAASWIDTRKGGFQLEGELAQLLGPETRRLTLFGLNLTSLAYDSLLGIISGQLDLKISYTSLARLPLEQVLNGVSKRTRLNLDFRNNNIQSLDVSSLQILDELQLNNQILQRGDHSSLRLASNPIRCDCQTRPLWLWLNQRWANVELPPNQLPINQQQEDSAQAASDPKPAAGSSANNWLKFSSSVLQTSDIKCHYPAKLRGKLAQYVNYHDLVCRGSPSAASSPIGMGRQSRKRNETKPNLELSYYSKDGPLSIPPSGIDFEDLDPNGGNGEPASDYWDLDAAPTSTDGIAPVRVTKFNRFPSLLFNQTIYYLQNIPVPFISDNHQDHHHNHDHHQRQPARTETDFDFEPDPTSSAARVSKRDRNSVDSLPVYPILADKQIVNTKYSRHRPNTQQRHAPFDTLSSLRQFQPAHHHSSGKQTLLTDSDVYILTIMSIAMSIMSFVIITICLFKYKMDRSDKERILSDHGKMLMSQALFNINSNMAEAGFNHLQLQKHHQKQLHSASGSRKSSSKKSSSSSDSSGSGSASKTGSGKQKGTKDAAAAAAVKRVNLTTSHKLQTFPMKADTSSGQLRNTLGDKLRGTTEGQVLVPMQLGDGGAAGASQNFLMRSPTIRRMQGLATNASEWFKYTLRAYPNNVAMHGGGGAHRRRRLFLGNTVPVVSQLTTGKRGIEEQLSANEPGSPATLAVGCPHHAFKAVDKLKDRQSALAAGVDLSNTVIEEKCLHCARLLATIQQTKVQYLIGGTSNKLRPDGKQSGSPKQQQLDESRAEEVDHNNSEDHCFVPPSVIRALAEQLDQANAESNYVALGPEWLQQEQQSQQQQQQQQHQRDLHNGDPTLSSVSTTAYYKREQRVLRPMRSFGMTDRGSTGDHEKHQLRKTTGDDQPLAAAGRQSGGSQIPSVDVIGRFAYQSDSQVDTPTPYDARCSSMLEGSSQMDGSEDTNGGHYNRDGVFILVPDDTSSSEDDRAEPVSVLLNSKSNGDVGGNGKKQRAGSGSQCQRLEGTGNGAGGETMRSTDSRLMEQQEESSMIMQDECSQSSSPVAYGFMRNSGPSSLASSSAAAVASRVQQQPQPDHSAPARYLPRDYSHHHHHQPPKASISLHQIGYGRTTSHYSSTSNNNNNNNHIEDNYSVIKKKNDDESIATSSNDNNEQLIVSRL